ncbi:ABC transporter substrate-binding protein [Paenibacillus hamazuiensis]|uniref:ABC transporter substrate-binding protein n=1 Tax=Paenibacillus hamazuiensis TaxID=2936508 RepID=UPI002010895F|nr:sugar ABC transporter substrate-binding protein [Paenibacillus hamazuiensis]
MEKTRKALKISASAVLCISMLAACSNSGTSKSNEVAGTGKPFQNKKLTVFMANHPWVELIKSYLPEFENKTGMKVDIQSFADDQLSQKNSVQLTSKAATPDVFMIRPLQEARLYAKNDWLEPLDEYVKKDTSYDFNDFSKSAVAGTIVNNKIMAIPVISDQEVLYYRKDLLAKAGLSVPKTLDELENAIKKLHDPDNGVYGFVARGQRALLVAQASSFLFSEGGDFTKGDKAVVNSPEAIKAFKYYGGWLKNYGPPGVMNMSWPQAMGLFAQGKAAFFTDASSIYQNAIDKEKSKVADQVGYALFPAGSAGSKPYNITAWGISLNPKSTNKDGAWEFIKWATSKEMTLRTQKTGVPGVRDSVWNNPEAVSSFPPELVSVIKESKNIGVGYDRPQIVSVGEARDAIGDIVIKYIMGEDIQAAADKANKDFQAIIDKDKSK